MQNKKILNHNTTIILTPEKTLPYSFFRYIFVNQTDFENGKIEQELLLHEEAHCEQYHSIDILIIELLYIFLWFNPVIWLFRREIMLNHEYSADNKVLVDCDSGDYQQLLLSAFLLNNTNYLVSNFKFSLIQSRIIMMTKEKPSNAIFRKIAGITIFLILGISLTLSKANGLIENKSILRGEGALFLIDNEKPDLFPIRNGDYIGISRTFGDKNINPVTKNKIVHYGIDIKAKSGTKVIATAGGKVIKAEYQKDYGNHIIIDHGDGYQSLYGHLKDFDVKYGDSVAKGQTIGHVGSSGLSTEPHLHFEISLKGDRINPIPLLK